MTSGWRRAPGLPQPSGDHRRCSSSWPQAAGCSPNSRLHHSSAPGRPRRDGHLIALLICARRGARCCSLLSSAVDRSLPMDAGAAAEEPPNSAPTPAAHHRGYRDAACWAYFRHPAILRAPSVVVSVSTIGGSWKSAAILLDPIIERSAPRGTIMPRSNARRCAMRWPPLTFGLFAAFVLDGLRGVGGCASDFSVTWPAPFISTGSRSAWRRPRGERLRHVRLRSWLA